MMTQKKNKKPLSGFKKFIVLVLLAINTNYIQAQQLLRVVVVGLSHDHVHGILNQFNKGEVNITKLDLVNKIISGTFWFDVKDNLGVVHQIREGRFDMEYTN